MQHCSELPCEVYRIANAGVHALSAYGAVDVRRITEQEHAVLAKMVGYPMVDAVG